MSPDSPIPRTRPPSTSRRFKDLPLELQDMIWTLTLPTARDHYAVARRLASEPRNEEVFSWPLSITIRPLPLPVALRMNRVSRAVALRRLERFPLLFTPAENQPSRRHGYCDPKTDSLHILELPAFTVMPRSFFLNPFINISACAAIYGPWSVSLPDDIQLVSEIGPRRHIRLIILRESDDFKISCENGQGRLDDRMIPQGMPEPFVAEALLEHQPSWRKRFVEFYPEAPHPSVNLAVVDLGCYCPRHSDDRMNQVQEVLWSPRSVESGEVLFAPLDTA